MEKTGQMERQLPSLEGRVSPESLAHIVFRTNQLDRMIAWHNTVFGARVVFGNERLAFLTYDDEHHRIALVATQEFEPRPEKVAVGFYHAAFTYPDLGTLLATYRRLLESGITPWRSILHGPTVSFYYKDPDGNDFELQVDVFKTAEEATEWMQGPVYANDPIGTEFDPAEMIARYESGEPEETLMRRFDDPINP